MTNPDQKTKNRVYPYRGYTSEQLETLFNRTKQALQQSGIFAALKKTHPFGNRPLYDEISVGEMFRRILRHDALVKFGVRKYNQPLRSAPECEDYDTDCPGCGCFAVIDPNGRDKVLCRYCGIVPIPEDESGLEADQW